MSRSGWFKDSYRHYLAAKGIKSKYDHSTTRYTALKTCLSCNEMYDEPAYQIHAFGKGPHCPHCGADPRTGGAISAGEHSYQDVPKSKYYSRERDLQIEENPGLKAELAEIEKQINKKYAQQEEDWQIRLGAAEKKMSVPRYKKQLEEKMVFPEERKKEEPMYYDSEKDFDDAKKVMFKHGNEPDSKFDPRQLKMGMKAEMEHTDDPLIAKMIAKAHLVEFPDYYDRLKIVEKPAVQNVYIPKTAGKHMEQWRKETKK